MQQRVLLTYAKRGDQTIDRFPHRMAAASQHAIVPRGFPRQVDAACFEQFQLKQLALDIFRRELIPDALQHFAENHIGQPETLAIELRMDPICLGIPDALEVIDPDSGVDDHHAGYFATRPRREVSRAPSQVTFPRKRRILRCPRV